ncbi:MAG: hypothetical protein BGO78_04955 [Chloroflexi bacterium 44-23]|nr:MAG: hypothetical protein BGO78_04955 [Chloroflexi bacterium 44-23]
MKIALISTSKVPSTTANSIQVMKVCQAYRQLGLEVTLFVPGTDPCSWKEIAVRYGLEHEFDICWIKSRRGFNRYDFICSCITRGIKWHTDIFHSWMPQISIFLSLIDVPILQELHELPTGRLGNFYYKTLLKSKKKIRFLPITNALWQRYINRFGLDGKEIDYVIAPDGVDVERYFNLPSPSVARKQLNLADQWSAVYTGHLYPGRGMKLLVKLAEALPSIQFIWVGGKPTDVEFWQNEILIRGITNIHITGFVNNEFIPLYQSAGNVLLMPYERNVTGSSGGNTADICSPMKMFEYMAAERPIISSDLPVLHEVLNESNATFCDLADELQWQKVILDIYEQPHVYTIKAQQAKKDVQQYSWIKRSQNGLSGFVHE